MKNITLSGIKNMSEKELKELKENDTDAVRDIILTVENMHPIYVKLVEYKKSLDKKISKDQFNYSLAVKGIQNIIDIGIKQYMKDFCSNTNISTLLNTNDRIYIYNYFLESFLLKNFE